jgi:hypothetical protein
VSIISDFFQEVLGELLTWIIGQLLGNSIAFIWKKWRGAIGFLSVFAVGGLGVCFLESDTQLGITLLLMAVIGYLLQSYGNSRVNSRETDTDNHLQCALQNHRDLLSMWSARKQITINKLDIYDPEKHSEVPRALFQPYTEHFYVASLFDCKRDHAYEAWIGVNDNPDPRTIPVEAVEAPMGVCYGHEPPPKHVDDDEYEDDDSYEVDL